MSENVDEARGCHWRLEFQAHYVYDRKGNAIFKVGGGSLDVLANSGWIRASNYKYVQESSVDCLKVFCLLNPLILGSIVPCSIYIKPTPFIPS